MIDINFTDFSSPATAYESQHNEVRMVQGPDAPEPNKDTQNPSVEFYRKIKSSLVISYWTATLPLIRTASNQLRLPPLGPAAAIDSHGGPRRRRAFAFLTWRCDPEPALGGILPREGPGDNYLLLCLLWKMRASFPPRRA